MKKIMYTRPELDDIGQYDGGLSIIIPCEKNRVLRDLRGMDKEQLVKWLLWQIQKMNPHGTAMFNYQSLHDYVVANFQGIWDQEFEDMVFEYIVWASVPAEAINPRIIEDENIPASREFRSAWCDVTPEAKIDIDLVKAKEVQLEKLRLERQRAFVDLGFPQKLHPEIEEGILSTETKAKLQALRDVTEPLKSLVVEGYNDESVLQQIRDLGKLNV